VKEIGPVFLDETGVAQLVVPLVTDALEVPGLPELPEAPRVASLPPVLPLVQAPRVASLPPVQPTDQAPPVAPTEPVVQEPSGTTVWGVSAEAQPGLLDSGAVPHTVS
jgi:hypothetical protein